LIQLHEIIINNPSSCSAAHLSTITLPVIWPIVRWQWEHAQRPN